MTGLDKNEKGSLRLSTVEIRNFRGILDLTVELDDVTVLVGENNTGKTAFLEAIRICLDSDRWHNQPFEEYDYHLADSSSTPAGAKPIEIVLHIKESREATWTAATKQLLEAALVVDGEKRSMVICKFAAEYDAATGQSLTNISFLDIDGSILPEPIDYRPLLESLQSLCHVHYLSAIRDSANHFQPKGAFWQSFLSDKPVADDKKRVFESEFASLNKRLINSHEPFQNVRDFLNTIDSIIDAGSADSVEIEALPSKLFRCSQGRRSPLPPKQVQRYP